MKKSLIIAAVLTSLAGASFATALPAHAAKVSATAPAAKHHAAHKAVHKAAHKTSHKVANKTAH